jgi:alkanesulfonate monooxygenase SsuD/methylene tetrahydromethanopterin reductase-like flavin-dependent oxidoreductase (luciferase family)
MDFTQHPCRFGVQIARPRPASEWKRQAQRAEALGYDVFLMPDHFGEQFAIGPALAVVAEATTPLRIGTLV